MFRFLLPVMIVALVFNACFQKDKGKPPPDPPVTTDLSREKVEDGIEVTFYPTYGYRDGDNWIIPTRTWVHEKRRRKTLVIGEVAEIVAKIKLRCLDSEKETPKSRLVDFPAADSENQKVTIQFDSDPDKEQFQLGESKPDGVIEVKLTLSDATARRLLESQGTGEGSKRGWLTYRAVSQGHTGKGRIRLIDYQGVSVVSDIDDTIKVTEVPAERTTVLRNTFCREFIAAPGMADRYKGMGEDVAFHYVSGGPWQLYGPLYDFLISGPGGFPEGSFHLNLFPFDIRDKETRNRIMQVVTKAVEKDTASGSMERTYEHKKNTISGLIDQFPGRKFILIGDSGEIDPEVYREIKEKYPQQVQEIWIRDVVNDETVNKDRLDGMKIVKAEPIICASLRHYTKQAGMIEGRNRPTYARSKLPPCPP